MITHHIESVDLLAASFVDCFFMSLILKSLGQIRTSIFHSFNEARFLVHLILFSRMGNTESLLLLSSHIKS